MTGSIVEWTEDLPEIQANSLYKFGLDTGGNEMACFLAPAAEAVVTTVLQKKLDQKEREAQHVSVEHIENAQCAPESAKPKHRISWSRKLKWLNTMLWGGSALLCVEHIWHGEVVPFFPFLTAVKSGETAEMLAEMGSAGVTMAVLVTVVWVGMLAVSSIIEKRALNTKKLAQEEA